MHSRRTMLRAAATISLLIVLAALPATAGEGPVEFAEAEIFTEINATDGDAGFHMIVDGDDWRRVALYDPDGKKVFDVRGTGPLGEHGITGLTFESAEPPFDEFSLEEFKQRFPEGTYVVRGWAVDGSRMIGSAEFTHGLPEGPTVRAPVPDVAVSRRDAVIEWEPVAPPPGSEITLYEIIVSAEDSVFDLDVVVDPTTTSIRIPPEILVVGDAYKVEVLAKESSGNQTITEVPFTVSE